MRRPVKNEVNLRRMFVRLVHAFATPVPDVVRLNEESW